VAPPFGQQPPMGWPTAPPPARRSRVGVIAAVTVGVLLLVACLGLAGGVVLLRSAKTTATRPVSGGPLSPTADRGQPVDPQPTESEQPALQGPQASADPAADIDDLGRLCNEEAFYPQSPKRAGKAPHPVVLLIEDGSGVRYQDGTYYFSQGLSKAAEQTWASGDPKKVQMAACLDRVSAGSKIRGCKYDEPKPETVSLFRAGWRLRVYEVATGKKLLEKAMSGDDQKCPFVVTVYADKKIYAKVSERAVIAAMRNLVTK
jgi:hypothetical protein